MENSTTAITNEINLNPENEKSIFCKIDWFSAVVRDASIADCMRFLQLDEKTFSEDYVKDAFLITQGIYEKFRITSHGISFDISLSDFRQFADDTAGGILNARLLDPIRIDISGSGLDYMRYTLDIDIDKLLQDPSAAAFNPSFHPTRVDFAFDFINSPEYDFVGCLIDYIQNNVGTTGNGVYNRCSISNMTSAIRCDLRLDRQRTVYFGSPQSDRLLRVYDKKLQYIDLDSGLYKERTPYGKPDTWQRIELQTRNKVAQDLLYSQKDSGFFSVLRSIYDYYRFNDMQTPYFRRQIYKPWIDLFDFEAFLPCVKICILRNYDPISPWERKLTYYLSMMQVNLAKIFTMQGLSYCLTELGKMLRNMQYPDDTVNPDRYRKRWLGYLTDMNQFRSDWKNQIPADSPIYYDEDSGDLKVKELYELFDDVKLTVGQIYNYSTAKNYTIYDKNQKMLDFGVDISKSIFKKSLVSSFYCIDNNIYFYIESEF